MKCFFTLLLRHVVIISANTAKLSTVAFIPVLNIEQCQFLRTALLLMRLTAPLKIKA